MNNSKLYSVMQGDIPITWKPIENGDIPQPKYKVILII